MKSPLALARVVLLATLTSSALTAASGACGSTDEAAPDASSPDDAATGRDASPDTAPAPAPDAGADGPPAEAAPPNPYLGGAPITAPAGTWTYVPMSDVVCANGSTSGVGVNLSPTPGAPLLVFLMGGGACWNALTCLNGTSSNMTTPVGEAEIMADIPRVAALFDRTATTNPFRDASFVFVPYCTADIFVGDSERTYSFLTKSVTIKHRGARNTDAVVKRLLATYPAPPKIWLTGASGGGYGAVLSHHRFKTAWPQVRIDILDDCGPPVQPTGSTWGDMQAAWKAELPPGCTTCADDVSALIPHLASEMGQGRLALPAYTEDKTIRAFTQVGLLVAQDYTNALIALRGTMGPRQRMFLIASDSHVLLKANPLPTTSTGVSLSTWLQRFASDDPAWAHEGP